MQAGPGFICPHCHDDHQPPNCLHARVFVARVAAWLEELTSRGARFRAEVGAHDMAYVLKGEADQLLRGQTPTGPFDYAKVVVGSLRTGLPRNARLLVRATRRPPGPKVGKGQRKHPRRYEYRPRAA